MNFTIGDYSGDGHGIHRAFLVKMTADNISEEIILEAAKTAERATGLKLRKFMNKYDSYEITLAEYNVLLEHNIAPFKSGYEELNDSYFSVKNGGEELEDLSVLSLLMGYYGYGIDNFTYENIIFKNIETGVGYGLFNA